MGFDLSARNKAAGDFHWGAFGWSWALEAGMGLPFGHGSGVEPASFVYSGRPDGCSLSYNDGARVSAKEAKEMAKLARWIAEYQENLYNIFMREPEEKRKLMEADHHRLYTLPVRRDWVERLRDFADWAEKSGGFRVY